MLVSFVLRDSVADRPIGAAVSRGGRKQANVRGKRMRSWCIVERDGRRVAQGRRCAGIAFGSRSGRAAGERAPARPLRPALRGGRDALPGGRTRAPRRSSSTTGACASSSAWPWPTAAWRSSRRATSSARRALIEGSTLRLHRRRADRRRHPRARPHDVPRPAREAPDRRRRGSSTSSSAACATPRIRSRS